MIDFPINTVIMDFPTCRIREFVTENDDGSYTIFLNARLSGEGQRSAYKHAINHIINHDFEKYDVQAIEAGAHRRKGE